MLQIVIWMLCVYMVLKGVELWLIAAANTTESRTLSRAVSYVSLIIAVLAAGLFFALSLEQGRQFNQPSPYGQLDSQY